jgi:hypothetical protein
MPCGNTPAQKRFLTRFGWDRPIFRVIQSEDFDFDWG